VKSARSNLRFKAERARARAPCCAANRSAHTSTRSTLRHTAERTCLHILCSSSFWRSFLCIRLPSVAFPSPQYYNILTTTILPTNIYNTTTILSQCFQTTTTINIITLLRQYTHGHSHGQGHGHGHGSTQNITTIPAQYYHNHGTILPT
jgi:hypothetical protein